MFQPSEFTQANHRSKNLNVIGLSIVIPLRNQADSILPFLERLTPVLGKLDQNCEVIFIDDGSTDCSWNILSNLPLAECEFLSLKFSRHFGRDAAISAGLNQARGLAVITFNSDLQDSTELIPYMLQAWMKGYDVVHMKRTSLIDHSFSFNFFHHRLFQRLIGHFKGDLLGGTEVEATGSFRLLSRQVIDCITGFPERCRNMEDLYDWLGFSQVSLMPDDIKQTHFNIIPSHSYHRVRASFFGIKPFRILSWCGGLISFIAILYGLFSLVSSVLFSNLGISPSLAVVQVLLVGVQLLSLGVMGEYITRVLVEVKQRPLYLIEQVEQKTSLAQRQKRVMESSASVIGEDMTVGLAGQT